MYVYSIALCVGIISTCFLVSCVYRLRFHPLARYPGPLRYKISGWPLVYQCYKGNRHLCGSRDHARYGLSHLIFTLSSVTDAHCNILITQWLAPNLNFSQQHHSLICATSGAIVRTSPNSLSFSSPTALHQIYGSRTINVRKSQFYDVLDSGTGGSTTHTEIDKEKHAARRRILSHAFSDAALREAEVFIVDNVMKFVRLLGPDGTWAKGETWQEGVKKVSASVDDEWSGPRNMSDWFNWLAYDIMGNLVFGKSYNCLESEKHRRMPVIMTEGMKFGYGFAYIPFARFLQPLETTPLMQWLGGQTARDNAALVSYALSQFEERAIFEERRREGTNDSAHKDLMHYLLNMADPKTGIRPTRAELEGDSLSLIGAGADTIATSLSAVLFYLCRYPSTLNSAKSEVRTTFKRLKEIQTGLKLDSCIYLNACIEEALRLSPPVAAPLPREVMKGGIVVDGQYIPEGTVVGVSAYVVHHDEDVFPQSWDFRPERWIVGSDFHANGVGILQAEVSRAREAMCPFSLGSRGCIGKRLAYTEMRITLAALLWTFDLEEVESGERKGGGGTGLEEGRERVNEFQLFDCFGADRNGPVLRFRQRIQV